MTIEGAIAAAVLDALRPELDELRGAIHQAPAERPALLTAGELAAQLRVSRSTVARMRADGCPIVRVIDSPRYDLVEVIAWLRAPQLPVAGPRLVADAPP